MKIRVVLLALAALSLSITAVASPAVAAPAWTPPVDVSTTSGSATDPQLTVASDGRLISTWTSSVSGGSVIQTSFSTDDGVTWSVPAQLSSGSYASAPQVAAAADGSVVVAWMRFDGASYVIESSRSLDHGATWSTPVKLSPNGGSSASPQIAVSAEGIFTAIWQRHDGSFARVQTSVSSDHGLTWSPAITLSLTGTHAVAPQLLVSPDGTLTAIWQRGAIETSTSTDHGATWSAVTAISPSGSAPQLAVGADGRVFATWYVTSGADQIVQISTAATAGAPWTVPVTVSQLTGGSSLPRLAIAGDGTISVVWSRFAGGVGSAQVSSSSDSGLTWGPPVQLGTSNNTTTPDVVVDSTGAITAAWVGLVSSNYRVLASTSTDRGTTWTAAVELSAAGSSGFAPLLSLTSQGTIVAIWYRGLGLDALAQTSRLLAPITLAVPAAAVAAELAATGSDDGPLGLTAALLLLLGAAVVLGSGVSDRRKRHGASAR